MPALIGWAYWCVFFFAHRPKKKRVGQMIASVGHHQHPKPTRVHTHLLLSSENWLKQNKPKAGGIHTPPSCAAMIFRAFEAKRRSL